MEPTSEDKSSHLNSCSQETLSQAGLEVIPQVSLDRSCQIENSWSSWWIPAESEDAWR